MDVILYQYQNNVVSQRREDGYINLNQMAVACGRRVDNWKRLESTKELLAEFERQQSPYSDLREETIKFALITIPGSHSGTFAHPDIAIQFAQWCSPAFALQVSRWVREWMMSGQNPLSKPSDRSIPAEIEQIFAGLSKLGIKPELVESAKLGAIANTFPQLTNAVESAKELISSQMKIEDIPVSPTKLGILLAQKLGKERIPNARLVNQVLTEKGLQKVEYRVNSKGKRCIQYQLTEKGQQFGQLQLETASNSEKTLTVIRWFPKVIEEIRDLF
jgi:KilA-N domain